MSSLYNSVDSVESGSQQESEVKEILNIRKEIQRRIGRNEEAVIAQNSQSCPRCTQHPDPDFKVSATHDKLPNIGI